MRVKVKELKISNKLQKKIDMICRFVGVNSTLIGVCVRNIKWRDDFENEI